MFDFLSLVASPGRRDTWVIWNRDLGLPDRTVYPEYCGGSIAFAWVDSDFDIEEYSEYNNVLKQPVTIVCDNGKLHLVCFTYFCVFLLYNKKFYPVRSDTHSVYTEQIVLYAPSPRCINRCYVTMLPKHVIHPTPFPK